MKGSGKKTPKRQNHDEPKENMTEIVDSKSSFKNLNSAFEEQVGKLRSPVVDFGVDILQSLKILRPTLPRHKRTPVRNVNLCSDVAENVLEMCFEQEVIILKT